MLETCLFCGRDTENADRICDRCLPPGINWDSTPAAHRYAYNRGLADAEAGNDQCPFDDKADARDWRRGWKAGQL